MNDEEWNALYPIGTPVVAYPGVRPEDPLAVAVRKRQAEGRFTEEADANLCRALTTVTRTLAWMLGCGAPVVSVEGYTGGIHLAHIDVIVEPPSKAAVARG
ncbi:hypothetical protein ACLF6K_05755 [Streptomyces xanthophaeus]|uniref:hypothetical protein n=1 Tax=Streptomyces xanthophaeus TaxID=67385 RepID=UPI00399004C6